MTIQQRYIDLLKKNLLGWYDADKPFCQPLHTEKAIALLTELMPGKELPPAIVLCKAKTIALDQLINGNAKFWPLHADTMTGLKRLENIEYCFHEIITNNIPGDFIETGVWRGGATIFMKGLLTSINNTSRKVWVADSFEGLPVPDPTLQGELTVNIDPNHILAVSETVVRQNFEKYNLLDANVCFLKGWFKDTLPTAPIDQLALLRLDGDLYASTMDALEHLYPKLSVGGYVIVDDFGGLLACRKAVFDYRKKHALNEPILQVDWTGIYWKKGKEIA